MNGTYALPENVLLPAASVAAGSVLLACVGLLAARGARGQLPLRHGLLLTTLLLILALPVLAPVAAQCGIGWRVPSIGGNSVAPGDPEPAPLEAVPAAEVASTNEPAAHNSSFDTRDEFGEVILFPGAPSAPQAETKPSGSQDGDATGVEESTTSVWVEPRVNERAEAEPVHSGLKAQAWSRWESAGSLLVAVWGLGACVSLLRGWRGAARLRRVRRSAEVVWDERLVGLLEELSGRAGLRRVPALLASDDVPVPFVHGVRRPAVILPRELLSESVGAIRAVLIHELAHVLRRDLLVGRVQRIAAALYWWNPLVHRLNVRLADSREELCDNHVVQQTGDPHEYARVLLESASRAVAAPVLPVMGLVSRRPTPFAHRIDRLLQENRPMSTSLGRISRVLLLVFAFALGAVSTLVVVLREDLAGGEGSIDIALADGSVRLVDLQVAEPDVVPATRSDAASNQVTGDFGEPERVFGDAASADHDMIGLAFSEPTLPEESAGDPFAGDTVEEGPSFAGDAFAAEPAATAALPPPADFAPRVSDAAWDPFGGVAAPPLISPHDRDQPSSPQPPGRASEPVTGFPVGMSGPATIPGERSTGLATKSGLVLIRLVGNEDGSLKELRYLTEDLGNSDEAFDSLKERIESWIQTIAPDGDSTTEVQIAADRNLRYEHVARAVEVCEPLVDRVSFARGESEQRLEISIGFVRDVQGQRIVDQPVVFIGETLVQRGEIMKALVWWRSENATAFESGVTIAIRADADVDYKVVEEIVHAAQRAGFDRFALKALEKQAEGEVGRIERLIDVKDNTILSVEVTLNTNAEIRLGQTLFAWPADDAAGPASEKSIGLEVVEVKSGSSICRVLSSGPDDPVGYIVGRYRPARAGAHPI